MVCDSTVVETCHAAWLANRDALMAFLTEGGKVVAYATRVDIRDADQRWYKANGFSIENATAVPPPTDQDEYLEDICRKSTARINRMIQAHSHWHSFVVANNLPREGNKLPQIDPNLIHSDRHQDFTDLCVYHAYYEELFPRNMVLSEEQTADQMKMEYYQNKFNQRFSELMSILDWYDIDSDGVVQGDESQIYFTPMRRTRGYRSLGPVK